MTPPERALKQATEKLHRASKDLSKAIDDEAIFAHRSGPDADERSEVVIE